MSNQTYIYTHDTRVHKNGQHYEKHLLLTITIRASARCAAHNNIYSNLYYDNIICEYIILFYTRILCCWLIMKNTHIWGQSQCIDNIIFVKFKHIFTYDNKMPPQSEISSYWIYILYSTLVKTSILSDSFV